MAANTRELNDYEYSRVEQQHRFHDEQCTPNLLPQGITLARFEANTNTSPIQRIGTWANHVGDQCPCTRLEDDGESAQRST